MFSLGSLDAIVAQDREPVTEQLRELTGLITAVVFTRFASTSEVIALSRSKRMRSQRGNDNCL